MTMWRDFFLSILSMDEYNRGYKPGIHGLSGAAGTRIGDAVIQNVRLPECSATAGFCGLAYKLSKSVGTFCNPVAAGTTIISFRRRDQVSDDVPLLDRSVS